MREKLLHVIFCVSFCRITPAYAGKTRKWRATKNVLKDHPRVCGKNFNILPFAAPDEGSPPRMREKLFPFLTSFRMYRITPAYAGKTEMRAIEYEIARDHPRVCGKNQVKRPIR